MKTVIAFANICIGCIGILVAKYPPPSIVEHANKRPTNAVTQATEVADLDRFRAFNPRLTLEP